METDVVTGAFGFIGRYITRHLLNSGRQVRTITTHPDKPNPFGDAVQAFPYNFDKPDKLMESLHGASTLYNTYYIRFEYNGATFKQAVENTATLFECAKKSDIKKIIHISVTYASEKSNLPYFVGKGLQEKALIDSGMPYSIIRPTLVFGKEDILVNNIAWLIRKFPVFPIFGSGQYEVQPIYVEDLAAIAAKCANNSNASIIDAIGPETFTFKEFLQLISSKLSPNTTLVHVPPTLSIFLGRIIGLAARDILLTQEELKGLMDGLLTSKQVPNGTTHFTKWLEANKDIVGKTYTSELGRHFKWRTTS